MQRAFHACLIIALSLCFSTVFPGAQERLVYPRPVSGLDRRSEYPLRLLELALEKTGSSFSLTPSKDVMNKARVTEELKAGHLDVAWMVTNSERENDLLPIRICLFKGLGGWRVFLIKEGDEKRFSTVRKLSDLTAFTAGQQVDWPDTAILRNSGLRVETTTSYDPLFRMLQVGRIDYFPRSIMEIWAEADAYRHQGLVVEPRLLIRYPSAYYFFVNKAHTDLALRIERGLEQALADGSFDALLHEYHGDVIKKARVTSRLIIDIPNPALPPLTPLSRTELWFNVKDIR